MKTIITTSRLVLREMTQKDYPALSLILQDTQTMYAYEGAFNNIETQEWLDKMLARYKTDGFGLWAVILKNTKEMIGQTGLTYQSVYDDKVLEIGYLFNRKYWGNGYATEAAIACKEYAFGKLNASEVYSIIRDTNVASMNVAIRNGMLIRTRFIKHYRNMDMPHFAFSVRNKQ
ncbi:GNAT family N-acetyltransferase [uncultured Sphaerochaeta sp.]|uniref:GNAT family N-acetyltransferase n=1 Tax=uncultured Sphaerochaeta sp. TaxID=886478 RepID=UPI002A0A9272|nr:GNAT family N-acetyltransferase [uncultured Sphaerochaeta sp.]